MAATFSTGAVERGGCNAKAHRARIAARSAAARATARACLQRTILTGLACLAACLTCAGQSTPAVAVDPDDWSFQFAPYIWLVGFDGNLTIDGNETDGDGASGGFPGDLSISGFLAHMEARHGPWSFALSPVLLDLAIDGADSPPTDTTLRLSGGIVEGFATYDLGGGWDVLAGVRYYSLKATVETEFNGASQPEREASRDWIDPIVGLRVRGSFDETWSYSLRADIGGFGVGSDFAWNASAEIAYALSPGASVFAGYRALDFDFADGSGSGRVDYDVRLWGPLLGLSLNF